MDKEDISRVGVSDIGWIFVVFGILMIIGNV